MKKALLTIGTSLLVLGAQAQAGSWYIGGNAGYNVTQQKLSGSKGEKSTSWSFSPEIGTFLTNNFQVGAAITLAGEQTEYNDTFNRSIKSGMTGGSVYARYFFGNGTFRPFAGINVTILPGSTTYKESTQPTNHYKTINFGANLNAGFALALSARVTAVGSFGALGYTRTVAKQEGSSMKNITESFGISDAGTLGQRFNVGIYYTFLK